MPVRQTHTKPPLRASSLPKAQPALDGNPSPAEATAVFARCRAPLLRWFAAHARALPWREPFASGAAGQGALRLDGGAPLRDPYAAWIAEIMLQQTQVATIAPRFDDWMRRFPDVAALAAAPEEEVLRAWSGLGYYARARNLRKGAQFLVARGAWPVSARDWREVPGVGDYTAGAVSSLAFGRPEPILDGNVIRVFSRLLALGFLPGDSAWGKRAYWELARLWADAPRPGDLNEAVMELGATVCTPLAPRCHECPLARQCSARASGRQGEFPPPRKRPAIESVAAVAVVGRLGGRLLLEKRAPGTFLAGHAMFPVFFGSDAAAWTTAFRRRFPGTIPSPGEFAGRFRHSIMSKRYEVEVRVVTLRGSRGNAEATRWVSTQDAGENITNSLARKVWEAAKGHRMAA